MIQVSFPNNNPPPPAEAGGASTTTGKSGTVQEPTMKDVLEELKTMREFYNQLKPKTEDKPAEESTGKTGEKEKEKPNAMVVDYAEFLKSQLGTSYDKELDTLPLDARIKAMKTLLSITNKQKIPIKEMHGNPQGEPAKPAKPVKVNGMNYAELAKKL
jgi:hypothetical protein